MRFALPIPPENATSHVAALTGIDPMVFTHNHSPGFEILPNGDALAVYFSTPPGESESAKTTSFVQARLRYGSEEWDLPELFFKTENYNDQSGLLWNDNGTIRFFGGATQAVARSGSAWSALGAAGIAASLRLANRLWLGAELDAIATVPPLVIRIANTDTKPFSRPRSPGQCRAARQFLGQ